MMMLRGVSRLAGKQNSICDVNITANDGEVTVLLGLENSGRSAICDILCGVAAAQSGSVLIDGYDMEKDPIEAKRHIGYMPQDPALFRDMTVRSQLRFIGQTREMSARALSEQVEKVIKKTRLSDAAIMPIQTLPVSYLQRAMIAQAIMAEVGNIVLDSPTQSLDAKQVYELRAILRDVTPGRAVVLATDNLSEAQALGDVIYVLSEGHVVGRCKTQDLAWLNADDEYTLVQVAAEHTLVQQALSQMQIEGGIDETDGVSSVCVHTGDGLEGRKQLSFLLAKAGLPIVAMRPREKSLEQIITQFENEPFAQNGEEKGEAE